MQISVSLATVAAFVVVGAVVGSDWAVVPVLVVTSALVALSAVDIVRYRLPDRLIFPSIGLALVAMIAVSIATDRTEHLAPAVVGAIAYFIVLLVPNLISPAGLAFGDVKLALLLGLTLGWTRASGVDSLRLVIWALLCGLILGLVSGILVGLGRRTIGRDFLPDPDFPLAPDDPLPPLFRTAFPFGPALALSSMLLVLFGGDVLAGTSLF